MLKGPLVREHRGSFFALNELTKKTGKDFSSFPVYADYYFAFTFER